MVRNKPVGLPKLDMEIIHHHRHQYQLHKSQRYIIDDLGTSSDDGHDGGGRGRSDSDGGIIGSCWRWCWSCFHSD